MEIGEGIDLKIWRRTPLTSCEYGFVFKLITKRLNGGIRPSHAANRVKVGLSRFRKVLPN